MRTTRNKIYLQSQSQPAVSFQLCALLVAVQHRLLRRPILGERLREEVVEFDASGSGGLLEVQHLGGEQRGRDSSEFALALRAKGRGRQVAANASQLDLEIIDEILKVLYNQEGACIDAELLTRKSKFAQPRINVHTNPRKLGQEKVPTEDNLNRFKSRFLLEPLTSA